MTRRSTSTGPAPIAMRMPISRVLLAHVVGHQSIEAGDRQQQTDRAHRADQFDRHARALHGAVAIQILVAPNRRALAGSDRASVTTPVTASTSCSGSPLDRTSRIIRATGCCASGR